MKKTNYILISIFSSLIDTQTFAKEISISDVVTRVKAQNFSVREKALRVYQSKQLISNARANLLPSINIWRAASLALLPVIEVSDMLGMVEDIAPFLIPNNWLKLKQNSILYLAELESYRALLTNEILISKGLYFTILADIDSLNVLREQKKFIEENILAVVQFKVKFGEYPKEILENLQVELSKLQEDISTFEVLIREQKTALMYSIGENQDNLLQIELKPIDTIVINDYDTLDYDKFKFRALNSSPELRQNDELKRVVGLMKKEAYFSLFGLSSTSIGVYQDKFSNIPQLDGLGFGVIPTLKISKAERAILDIQQEAISETVKQTLRISVDKYNLKLQQYKNTKDRLSIAESAFDRIYEKLKLGEELDSSDLIRSIDQLTLVKLGLKRTAYEIFLNKDRFERVILSSDYDVPAALVKEIKL